MHELPIVEDIITTVGREAEKCRLRRVGEITLVIGELSSVIDESVQMYFDLLSEGTACEGAQLRFEHRPAMLRCVACGKEFPHRRSFDCPRCGGESRLIRGTGQECYIRSIEGE